jgi:hypothetical protein
MPIMAQWNAALGITPGPEDPGRQDGGGLRAFFGLDREGVRRADQWSSDVQKLYVHYHALLCGEESSIHRHSSKHVRTVWLDGLNHVAVSSSAPSAPAPAAPKTKSWRCPRDKEPALLLGQVEEKLEDMLRSKISRSAFYKEVEQDSTRELQDSIAVAGERGGPDHAALYEDILGN